MTKKFFSMVFAAMLLIASVVAAEEFQQVVEIKAGGVIEVTGRKSYDPDKSLDELRRMAILDAYRYLAESIGNLTISSDSEMQRVSDLSDSVKSSVKATVNGARVVSVTRDDANNFIAKVRLNLYGGANSVANLVVPKDTKVEPFPKFSPKFENIDSNYTGLIIECGGQEISTAVLPKIQSASGKDVYAFKYLERNIVVGRGMVNYSDGANSGTQRAGNNPLTVQAMFIQGGCDVVVSDDDADKILAANQKSNFLKNCMVVFVK